MATFDPGGSEEGDMGSRRVCPIKVIFYKKRDFLGDPVVRASRFHCRRHGFDSWGTNTWHAAWDK